MEEFFAALHAPAHTHALQEAVPKGDETVCRAGRAHPCGARPATRALRDAVGSRHRQDGNAAAVVAAAIASAGVVAVAAVVSVVDVVDVDVDGVAVDVVAAVTVLMLLLL